MGNILFISIFSSNPPAPQISNGPPLMPDTHRLWLGALNINANRSSCYFSKIQHQDFDDLANDLDVIGITETHAALELEVQKQGYHSFAVVRKKAALALVHSGGIAVLVRNELAQHTTMCDWSNPCCITIKIKGSYIKSKSDLFVVTVYLPPEHSSYLRSTNTYTSKLAEAYDKIPPEAHVLLMGDFKAHTLNQRGTLADMSSDIIPEMVFDTTSIDPPPRRSLDPRRVDIYGHKLLQFCDDRSLTILNGCTPGDSQGYYSYEVGATRSVIDYSFASQTLWPLIRNFQIGLHNLVLSDHSLLITELDLSRVSSLPKSNAVLGLP